jgi:hypothetical protein
MNSGMTASQFEGGLQFEDYGVAAVIMHQYICVLLDNQIQSFARKFLDTSSFALSTNINKD